MTGTTILQPQYLAQYSTVSKRLNIASLYTQPSATLSQPVTKAEELAILTDITPRVYVLVTGLEKAVSVAKVSLIYHLG